MAPPWVKGPREASTVTMVSSPPWVKGPTPMVAVAPIPSSGFQSAPITPPGPPSATPMFSAPPNNTFVAPPPINPGQLRQPQIPNIQRSPESPKSLGALLQQAPLRAPVPSSSESEPSPAPSAPKPLLKGPKAPQAAGPLAGAKFVLPPIPIRAPLKGNYVQLTKKIDLCYSISNFTAVSGKSASQLAKIAELRHSIRPRPETIGGLLREIEGGTKLNHVACDDRSKPLIRRCQTFFPEF